jgi:hypothetical protein
MTADTQHGTPQLSAAALDEWSRHVEAVMRGVAHSLNNRAAAISAVIELSRDADDDPSVVASILGAELERVTHLQSVVRSIGAPRAGVEAFSPRDAAAEALEALKLHVDHADRPVAIEASGASPIRVPRWMFVRALIVLGAMSGGGGAGARITITDDGDWLNVSAGSERPGDFATSPYVMEVARAMGGGLLSPGAGFRVPTLAALRRREGR